MGSSNQHDGSILQTESVRLFPFVSNELFLFIRERVETLGTDNDTLRDQMRQTEKDTIDVISFMKKQDLEKDTEVNDHCR